MIAKTGGVLRLVNVRDLTRQSNRSVLGEEFVMGDGIHFVVVFRPVSRYDSNVAVDLCHLPNVRPLTVCFGVGVFSVKGLAINPVVVHVCFDVRNGFDGWGANCKAYGTSMVVTKAVTVYHFRRKFELLRLFRCGVRGFFTAILLRFFREDK